jgi:cytochrome c
MNSFELNKVMGAVLGACLVLLALNIASGAIFAPHKPEKPGFAIAVQEEHGGAAEAKKEPEKPIGVRLASASVEKGQAAVKVCQACHTFEKGGPNRVGPNLYDIVGHDRGTGRNGFNFSAAMKAKAGKWTYEELDKFLANPRGYIPGTNMSFAGISRDSQRADVIAYLRSLSDSPQPLPAAEAAAPAQQGGAAPAPQKGAAPAQGNAPAKPAEGQPK